MTKDELKPIDTSKYKITETGQVLKMTDEEKAELERRIASQRGTIRVYNNKLKSRLEQVERLKQENKELREENAKLKKELKISQRCWQDQKNISLNANCSLHKAKELIKEMLSILPKENIEGVYEITEEAEQFLRKGE